jgi:hypothetical protein
LEAERVPDGGTERKAVMASGSGSFLWIALMNMGFGFLVFLAYLISGGLARTFNRPGLRARAGVLPDGVPVDEWPLFSASVAIPGGPADAHTFDLPGLGFTMADGGERTDPPGAPTENPSVLPFSIRMPGSPDRTGADPDITFSVRVDDAVYTVTHSVLSGALRELSPSLALEQLSAGAYRALTRSGQCRVLSTMSSFVAGRPARVSRFEVRPYEQAPYVLATAILHLDDRALAVSYGDRARRFRRNRFTSYLATLSLSHDPADPLRDHCC